MITKLDYAAGDHSPEALAAAAQNAALMKSKWCSCKTISETQTICPNCGMELSEIEPGLKYCPDCKSDYSVGEETVYFQNPLGHGWMCAMCYGIVQTG